MNKDKRVQSKSAQKEPIKRNKFHKYVPSILLFLLFEIVAVTLWLVKDNLFYLLNFSYIGGCLGLGTALFTAGKRYARHFVQLAVGSYMLLYLGVLSRYSSSRWVIFHFYVSIVTRVNVFIVINVYVSARWTWKLIKNPESGKMERNAFFVMNARKFVQQRRCIRKNGFVVME